MEYEDFMYKPNAKCDKLEINVLNFYHSLKYEIFAP